MELIRNKKKFNFSNPLHVAFLGQQIADMFAMPDIEVVRGSGVSKDFKRLQNFVQRDENGKLQMMSTPDDFPAYLLNLFKEFQTMTVFDEGYKQVFDERPLTGTDGYDVLTTENNIQFQEIAEGGRIIYYGSAGSKYRVYAKFYGGGHGVDRRLIITKDFYQIGKDMLALRNQAYLKKAQVAYGLIDAIGSGINLAWQTHPDGVASGTASYQVGRDIATLNKARETLITNNKTKTELFPNGISAPVGILAPYQLEGRLDRALGFSPVDGTSKIRLTGTWLKPIYTTLLSASDKIYVFIPKGKSTAGNLLDLTQFNGFNKDNLTQEVAGWMAYAFDCGDTAQFVRCSTS